MQGKLLGLAVLALGTGSALAQDAASAQFYSEKVLPVLQANCYSCHGGTSHRGGLSLTTKAAMLKGGHDGSVLAPGSSPIAFAFSLSHRTGLAGPRRKFVFRRPRDPSHFRKAAYLRDIRLHNVHGAPRKIWNKRLAAGQDLAVRDLNRRLFCQLCISFYVIRR